MTSDAAAYRRLRDATAELHDVWPRRDEEPERFRLALEQYRQADRALNQADRPTWASPASSAKRRSTRVFPAGVSPAAKPA